MDFIFLFSDFKFYIVTGILSFFLTVFFFMFISLLFYTTKLKNIKPPEFLELSEISHDIPDVQDSQT